MQGLIKSLWVVTKWSLLVGLLLFGGLVWLARKSIPKPGEAASWSPRF
jgi:hypothetical protein